MGLRVLVDLDGVVIDTLPLWLSRYNQRYDDNLTMGEFAGTWKVSENVRSDVGAKVFDILKEKDFYENALPIPGAISSVNSLIKDPEIEIYVVSAFMGNGAQAQGKCAWLESYLPSFPVDNIILCHDKYLIDGDVLIDDYEGNIRDFIEYDPMRSGILFGAPHNRLRDTYKGNSKKTWSRCLDNIYSLLS